MIDETTFRKRFWQKLGECLQAPEIGVVLNSESRVQSFYVKDDSMTITLDEFDNLILETMEEIEKGAING